MWPGFAKWTGQRIRLTVAVEDGGGGHVGEATCNLLANKQQPKNGDLHRDSRAVRGFKWKEKSGTKKYSGRTMAEDVRNGYLSSDTHPKSRRLVDGVLLLGKHNETVQWANAMPWNKAEMENAAAR